MMFVERDETEENTNQVMGKCGRTGKERPHRVSCDLLSLNGRHVMKSYLSCRHHPDLLSKSGGWWLSAHESFSRSTHHPKLGECSMNASSFELAVWRINEVLVRGAEQLVESSVSVLTLCGTISCLFALSAFVLNPESVFSTHDAWIARCTLQVRVHVGIFGGVEVGRHFDCPI
jgi:hypothetical protein